jgi:hypothetical protein
MHHKKDNETLIRNEDTLVRRAWIESAMEGVRALVDSPLPAPETGDLVVDVAAYAEEADEPQLYVVWDADARRSGT